MQRRDVGSQPVQSISAVARRLIGSLALGGVGFGSLDEQRLAPGGIGNLALPIGDLCQ